MNGEENKNKEVKPRADREITKEDLKYMNIPASYWGAVIEGRGYSEAIVVAVNNIIESLSKNMVTMIVGGNLSGKTSLAALHLMEAWRKHCSCFMIDNSTMWNCREDEFSEGVTIFERCRRVGVLVIDDICVGGYMDEKNIGALRTILRYRADWMKPTILVFGMETAELVSEVLPSDIRGIIINNCKTAMYQLQTKRNTSTIG